MHVERFENYIEDLSSFLDTVVSPAQPDRLFVFGHSTGALIAALYLENHPATFKAGVLCSPFFDVAVGLIPGFVARALAHLLDRPRRQKEYGPGQRDIVRPDFQNNKITSSYPRWSLWEQEIIPNTKAIQFGGVTNHWLRESLTAGARAVRQAGRIAVPLLLLQAGADQVVELGAQERFCRRARRCTKVRIRGARHEIHIERDELRNEALDRVKNFLSVQLQET
jgi:lysophospholipase